MNKYIFLYLAPPTIDQGFENPPFTWDDLEKWAALAGSALVDKGMLFGPSGKDVVDTGVVQGSAYQIYGYSVVQAENMDAAVALAKTHPILIKERRGFYEIQIQEAFAGDVPDSILHPPVEEEPEEPTSYPGTLPPPENPTPNPPGQLNVPHG